MSIPPHTLSKLRLGVDARLEHLPRDGEARLEGVALLLELLDAPVALDDLLLEHVVRLDEVLQVQVGLHVRLLGLVPALLRRLQVERCLIVLGLQRLKFYLREEQVDILRVQVGPDCRMCLVGLLELCTKRAS